MQGWSIVPSLFEIDESGQESLLNLRKKNGMGLTIIGPEVPLFAGLADRFRRGWIKGIRSNKEQLRLKEVNHLQRK